MGSNGRKSPPDRKRRELAITRLRSAVTNGSLLLANVDRRSAQMRRLRDLIELHTGDLGGDDANISEGERQLIRRAAMLELLLEMQDAKFATNPEAMDKATEFDAYLKATGALRRVLQAIGLQRRQRDVTPTLDEYLRGRARAAE